jgi:GNAT superfamily N-acetyltransferase
MDPLQMQSLDPFDWAELLDASRAEGHNMVNRLLRDFRAGTNRFDAPGEILLAHAEGQTIVGVGGLNLEPECSFARAGRVRRLYILPRCRAHGLGRSLVDGLASFAASHHDRLTVNVGKLAAGGFYEHLGFTPVEHAHITHVMELTGWAEELRARSIEGYEDKQKQ